MSIFTEGGPYIRCPWFFFCWSDISNRWK